MKRGLMDPDGSYKIDRNYNKLMDNLEPKDVIPKLIAFDVIDLDDEDMINNTNPNTRRTRVREFLKIIKYRGEEAYPKFIETLEFKHYSNLVNDLEATPSRIHRQEKIRNTGSDNSEENDEQIVLYNRTANESSSFSNIPTEIGLESSVLPCHLCASGKYQTAVSSERTGNLDNTLLDRYIKDTSPNLSNVNARSLHCAAKESVIMDDVKVANILTATGKDINFKDLLASTAILQSSQSINLDTASLGHLNAAGKNVNVRSVTVNRNSNVLATENALVQNCEMKYANIQSKYVHMENSHIRDNTRVEASATADIHDSILSEGHIKCTAVNLSNVNARTLHSTAKEEISMDEINVTNTLTATGKDINGRDLTASTAILQSSESLNLDTASLGHLNAAGKNVNVRSVTVDGNSSVLATEDACIQTCKMNSVDIQGRNVKVDNTIVKDTMNVETSGSANIKDITINTGQIKGNSVNLSNIDANTIHCTSEKETNIASMNLNNTFGSMNGTSRIEGGSINLLASSINVQGDLTLHANKGKIVLGAHTSLHVDSVIFVAKEDIIHNEKSMVTASEDVIEKSIDGSISLFAAIVKAGRYVEMNAAKNINILAVSKCLNTKCHPRWNWA